MAKLIQQLQVGSTDTLLVAERANELIDALNALLNMQVQPADYGSFSVGEAGNAQLTLKKQQGELVGNVEKDGDSCVDGVALNSEFTVPANMIYSVTQANADNFAQLIANLGRICVSEGILNGYISSFVNTYLRVSSYCNEDGTITTTLSNSYPTPQP